MLANPLGQDEPEEKKFTREGKRTAEKRVRTIHREKKRGERQSLEHQASVAARTGKGEGAIEKRKTPFGID